MRVVTSVAGPGKGNSRRKKRLDITPGRPEKKREALQPLRDLAIHSMNIQGTSGHEIMKTQMMAVCDFHFLSVVKYMTVLW